MGSENVHIDIMELERFTLESLSLSPGRRAHIAAHLHECPDCRRVESELSVFYRSIEPVNADALSPAVERILSHARSSTEPPRIVELFPHRRTTHPDRRATRVLALAADHGGTASRYAHGGTLASRDEQTFLRLTRDRETEGYILQVLGEWPEEYAHVLVSFDAIQGMFLTDRHGEATIRHPAELDVHALHAFVRRPLDRFTMPPREERQRFGENGISMTVLREPGADTLCLTFVPTERLANIDHPVAIVAGGVATLLPLEAGAVVVPVSMFDAADAIILF
jgi:hypothetical protein